MPWNGCKPGTSPVTCPKCNGKERSFIPSSPSLDRYRTQTCPDCRGSGKIIKRRNARTAMAARYISSRRRSR
ncbi:MAG: zinc finger domain-containing protein [Enterocloster sp.]